MGFVGLVLSQPKGSANRPWFPGFRSEEVRELGLEPVAGGDLDWSHLREVVNPQPQLFSHQPALPLSLGLKLGVAGKTGVPAVWLFAPERLSLSTPSPCSTR